MCWPVISLYRNIPPPPALTHPINSPSLTHPLNSPYQPTHPLGIELSSQICVGPLYRFIETSHVFQSMTALNLSNNKLTYIPATFQYLPGLKRLNLSGNMLGVKSHSHNNNHTSNQRSKEGMGMGMGIGRNPSAFVSHQDKNPTNDRQLSSPIPIVEIFPPTLTALDVSHNQLDSSEFSHIIRCLVLLNNNHNHAPPVKPSHQAYPPISQGRGGATGGAVPAAGGGRVAATPTSSQVLHKTRHTLLI